MHSVTWVFVHRAFSIRLKNFWAESASLRYSQPCDKLTMYFVVRSSGSGISWKRPNLKQIIVLIDATSMPCFLHLLQPQGWTHIDWQDKSNDMNTSAYTIIGHIPMQSVGWHPWASDASLSCMVFCGIRYTLLSSAQFDNQEWRVEIWKHYKSFLCIPQMASINRMETSKGKVPSSTLPM